MLHGHDITVRQINFGAVTIVSTESQREEENFEVCSIINIISNGQILLNSRDLPYYMFRVMKTILTGLCQTSKLPNEQRILDKRYIMYRIWKYANLTDKSKYIT